MENNKGDQKFIHGCAYSGPFDKFSIHMYISFLKYFEHFHFEDVEHTAEILFGTPEYPAKGGGVQQESVKSSAI